MSEKAMSDGANAAKAWLAKAYQQEETMTQSGITCAICEHGPPTFTCERCTDIEERLKIRVAAWMETKCSFGHPDHAGVECFVLVPKVTDGFPQLAKAFLTDPDPLGRQREGVPVSMGALWGTREEAEDALARLVPGDLREGLEVRPVIVKYAGNVATEPKRVENPWRDALLDIIDADGGDGAVFASAPPEIVKGEVLAIIREAREA